MRLRYIPRALAELDKILADIERESPQGALRLKARVQAVIGLVLQYPHAAPIRSKRGLRRIVAHPHPFLIFYKATGHEVV